MKRNETVLREWALGKIRFHGLGRHQLWTQKGITIISDCLRKPDTQLIGEAWTHRGPKNAPIHKLLDYSTLSYSSRELRELGMMHLVTPLWVAGWTSLRIMYRVLLRAATRKMNERHKAQAYLRRKGLLAGFLK